MTSSFRERISSSNLCRSGRSVDPPEKSSCWLSSCFDSGVLTAPCGGADNSSDVDLFGEIGSHIWSTIYLTIRGGRLGVLKSGLVVAAGVAGPRNRRRGLSRRRIGRERWFWRGGDGTRSV